jgi:hypothetical protein
VVGLKGVMLTCYADRTDNQPWLPPRSCLRSSLMIAYENLKRHQETERISGGILTTF